MQQQRPNATKNKSIDLKKKKNKVHVLNTLWRRKWKPTPFFLPGEFPWTAELAGQSMGS